MITISSLRIRIEYFSTRKLRTEKRERKIILKNSRVNPFNSLPCVFRWHKRNLPPCNGVEQRDIEHLRKPPPRKIKSNCLSTCYRYSCIASHVNYWLRIVVFLTSRTKENQLTGFHCVSRKERPKNEINHRPTKSRWTFPCELTHPINIEAENHRWNTIIGTDFGGGDRKRWTFMNFLTTGALAVKVFHQMID